jgi:hypothetical protein
MLILEVAAGIVLAFFVIVYFNKIIAAVLSAVQTFVYAAGALAVIAIIALTLPDVLRFAETPEAGFHYYREHWCPDCPARFRVLAAR